MRQNILSILFLIFILASCRQEVSQKDFREMMSKQCKTQMAPVYLGTEHITDEQLTSFCDCYIEYLVGDNEIITSEVINEAMAKQEEVIEVLSECAIDAKNLNKPTDSLNMNPSDSVKLSTSEMSENSNSLTNSDN